MSVIRGKKQRGWEIQNSASGQERKTGRLILRLSPWWKLSLTLSTWWRLWVSVPYPRLGLTTHWPQAEHWFRSGSWPSSKNENLAATWPLTSDLRQLLWAGHNFGLHIFISQEQTMQLCSGTSSAAFRGVCQCPNYQQIANTQSNSLCILIWPSAHSSGNRGPLNARRCYLLCRTR